MVTRGELAFAELRIRLAALLRGLRPAVERRSRRTAALTQPELSHLGVTEQHALVVLDEAESLAHAGRDYGPGTALTHDDVELLGLLESRAGEIDVELPGRLLERHGLSELDVEILLLTAAPGVDPAFATLYGYVHDVMTCVSATTYLAVQVLATDCDHERRVIEACGPFGALRGEGLVLAGPDQAALTALTPAAGITELLSGARIDRGLLGRRVVAPLAGALPVGVDAGLVGELARALASRRLDAVGVWGPPGGGEGAVIAALLGDRKALHTNATDAETALQRAAVSDAVCVVHVPTDHDESAELAGVIAASSAAVLMVGAEPLHSPALMLRRRFAELRIPAHGFAGRRASWSAAFPELPDDGIDDLAARFRLRPDDVAAVAALDRAARGWAHNGRRPALDELAGLVSRRRSPQVATIRSPERQPDMLVLPDAELAAVMEVAGAARAWPRVAERWRLGRFGNPGVTALFAGDPGTGKTLAAEVIATVIGIDLMIVDLSRLVSKWIGETEKNLDSIFTEAEESNCVLFFDEADSIFGQRGKVERGADRYANLEVGYLLQRLERYEGLVILASNLRANLDPAFTRRFHHVVHFPRPTEPQRRRLWQLAIGPPVQLAEPLEIELLAALDMTGAGIAAAVRGAALAVHADGRRALTAADVIAAISRQFQREARLLPRELLGRYAGLLG